MMSLIKRLIKRADDILPGSMLVAEAKKSTADKSFTAALVATLIIGYISDFVAAIVIIVGKADFYSALTVKFAMLYLLTFGYVKLFEKRSIKSMGFVKKGAIRNYFTGLLAGSGMFLTVYIINIACGSIVFGGNAGKPSLAIVAAFLFFVFQGMAEEVLYRGLLQISVAKDKNNITGVLLSALVFALVHAGNPGADFSGIFNIFIYGIFISILMLKTDSIFMISGMHTAWNFTMGNVFGVKVSGLDMESSLFKSEIIPGKELLSGGSFGIEGGLIFTAVISIVIAFTVIDIKKKKELKD